MPLQDWLSSAVVQGGHASQCQQGTDHAQEQQDDPALKASVAQGSQGVCTVGWGDSDRCCAQT